jgi:hypothetical protein
MTAYDDPLLGMSLPTDDPAATRRLAEDLRQLADRLGGQGDRVGAMVGVEGWSGTASTAADRRLSTCRLVLRLERTRLLLAADALDGFSGRVAVAQVAAGEARRLVAAARGAQLRADRLDPVAARSRDATATGHRFDGSIYAPDAAALLARARDRALASRTCYDAAATALAAALTSLSGRRVLRRAADGRLLLDLLGFVPVVGTVVDVCDVLTYGSQGRWEEAGVTVASAVPGPVGWVVTAAGIVSSLAHMGEVAGIERTAPTPPVVPVVPVAREVSDSTPVRVSEPVPARGPRRRRPRPTSPRPP